MPRGTTNRNARGSTRDRQRRRAWLLKVYASDVDGYARCFRCGCLLTEATLTIDRIVPGKHGGRYVRNNIRPCCTWCNVETGSKVRWCVPLMP